MRRRSQQDRRGQRLTNHGETGRASYPRSHINGTSDRTVRQVLSNLKSFQPPVCFGNGKLTGRGIGE